MGARALSRVGLSFGRAGTATDYQASGINDFAEPLSDLTSRWTQQVITMSATRKKKMTKTVKGDQTKALILETALEMLRERGYDETTMRAIAEKAGVSLGNAYYYFS